MKLITVVGARPQFIKAAAVSNAIHACSSGKSPIVEKILHTGQHYDAAMSDQFFSELGIPEPAFHLGIGGGTHGSNTGRMLEEIEGVLLKERPDALLVYGDTDSTLAGALAASKLKIPVVHVEAGLRSFNRHQPEEQNRVLTDHLAEICFAPTDIAVEHLHSEGIPQERIVRTGDVMADVARIFGEQSVASSAEILNELNIPDAPFILSTIHRAENTDDHQSLESILKALGEAALPVVLPLHPRTSARIDEYNLTHLLEPLHVTEPLGFLAMVLLERLAVLVVTDSGGVQKEAFFQGTPCVTVRSETEWVELVECGWNLLSNPTDSAAIISSINDQLMFDISQARPSLYGDGYAADAIVARLQEM